MRDKRTYRSWDNMKSRCSNPNTPKYKYYGGRGISYTPDWEMYENFIRDMGIRPENHTLDRIDNDLGYSKNNCRWASKAQQMENRSCTILVDLNGFLYNTKQLMDIWKLSYNGVLKRVKKFYYLDKQIYKIKEQTN